MWDYSRRVGRWFLVLGSIHGQGFRDKAALLGSAALSPLVSLRGLGKWQDPILFWDAKVRVAGVGRFLVRRRTDDLWHVLPARERSVMRAVAETVGPGDVFVDAGANIGFFSVFASGLVGSSGRVLAIEMMPDTAGRLRKHVAMNGLMNVKVIEGALSDKAGQGVTARIPVGKHGQASITSSVVGDGIEVSVLTTTLADVLAEVGEVALMKMDLEGAEVLALRGAGDSLGRVRAIVFEDWGGDALAGVLRANGFDVRRLDGNNSLATNRRLAKTQFGPQGVSVP